MENLQIERYLILQNTIVQQRFSRNCENFKIHKFLSQEIYLRKKSTTKSATLASRQTLAVILKNQPKMKKFNLFVIIN
jgi:hypothetical protein